MRRSMPLSLSLVAVFVACCVNAACAKPDAVYRVAGRVIAVSGRGPDLRVVVSHEAIAGFKDRDGNVARMPAMTMAFGVAKDVDAKLFTPGSQWEFEFDVAWNREPVLRIDRAKALPADAKLALAPDRH